MSNTKKYICIHGHFYQPPRENAWMEFVEIQETAKPFHDWNDRINFECYAPNAAARILNDAHKIIEIINNYEHISFNFGPTLLSWLELNDQVTYQAILDADRKSLANFGGSGTALAQVYNHMIMPLANQQDKVTQVVWGIRDFESRFKRKPEGIWLAETAVCTDTLEVLVDHGILFTILAPGQAKAIRNSSKEGWSPLTQGIDTTQPYCCELPSGRSITLFFYNGAISQSVAFNGLLNNGKDFAKALLSGLRNDDTTQLSHIATDGETYGHHHRYGEMALSDCIAYLGKQPNLKLTNYAQYLKMFPPTSYVQIHGNSSWSCVHGVERWKADCGCCTGGNPGWNQKWRKPLREALDWLRDELLVIFLEEGKKYFISPMEARDGYIDLILDRSERVRTQFVSQYTKRTLLEVELIEALRLLEMQRNAMLMYTSCGWFFDEISGIETNQILQYALRAMQFAKDVAGVDLEQMFEQKLTAAPSNVHANGAVAYLSLVKSNSVRLADVGRHLSIASVFERFPRKMNIFNNEAIGECFDKVKIGGYTLVTGRFTITSTLTLYKKQFSFVVLYLGQHHLLGKLSEHMDRTTFDTMQVEVNEVFRKNSIADVITKMQQYFGNQPFNLWDLFADEKRKIFEIIMNESLEATEKVHQQLFDQNYQLLTSLIEHKIKVPETFLDTIQVKINIDLQNFFRHGHLNIEELSRIEENIQKLGIKITHKDSLRFLIGNRVHAELQQMSDTNTLDIDKIAILSHVLEVVSVLKIQFDLWKCQNVYFKLNQGLYQKASTDLEWNVAFERLGALLNFQGDR